MKFSFGKRELAIVSGVLFVAFLFRILFFPEKGYQIDTGDFISWFRTAADYGPRFFYDKVWCDYPPLNIYFFWSFGSLAKSLSLFSSDLLLYVMKLPSNLFDMATAFVIFLFIRKRATFKLALLGTALYAFNPAVIYNTAVWGQFDAIYTFFLVASLYLALDSKPHWATAAFILGILTKPQSIALAPLFLYLVLRKNSWRLKGTLISAIVAVVTIFAVILPFNWSDPIAFLSGKYFGAYSTYPYTTLNAFNVWGFGGMWVSDVQGLGFLTPYVLGWAMFAVLAAFAVYFVHKRWGIYDESVVLFAAFILFFGFFMLPTRIHERYLFPAMAMLVLMFPLLKKTRPLYVILTATCFINQAYVLNALVAAYPSGPNLTGDPVVFIVSLINSLALVYVIMLMFGELWGKRWLSSTPVAPLVNTSKGAVTYDTAR